MTQAGASPGQRTRWWPGDRQLALPSVRSVAVACAGTLFFLAFWFSHPRPLSERPVFNSPREAVGYHLTERFLDGHGFSAPLLHYDELPRTIAIALTPRDAASLDGAVLPKDFAGTMLLYAAAMALHPSLALVLAPAFALLGAWALMRLTEELFGTAAGFIAFCVWLAFPPLWMISSFIFMADPPALAMLLLSALTFLRFWRNPTSRGAAVVTACLCAAVMFRYPNVLLVVPFVAAPLIRRRLTLTHAAAAAAVAAGFIGVLLSFNQLVYGAPFTTGFHLGAQLISDTVHYSGESFFKRRPDVFLQYLRIYGGTPVIAVPVVGAFAATAFVALRRRGEQQLMALMALAIFALLAYYYGGQDAWGYTSAQLNASVLRYLLPGFALLAAFGAGAIAAAARRAGWVLYLVPLAIVVASAWSVQRAPGGTRELYAGIRHYSELHTEIVASTEPDAIIAVRTLDKVLFPERQTLTLTYAIQHDEPFSKGGLETWDHVASPERFAEIAERIDLAGIPLYFLPDALTGPVAPYEEALAERGYSLQQVSEVESTTLFMVARRAL